MKKLLSFRSLALLSATGVLMLLSNTSALACAACYGDTSGSRMGNAAQVGIFAMVVIMIGMLSAIAAFGWHLAYRAKHPLPDYSDLLKEDEVLPKPATSS